MPVGSLEKRVFPRVPCRFALRYQVRGAGHFDNALSEDISVNGISFVNNSFIPVDTHLGFEINVCQMMLSPVGKVAWVARLPYAQRYRVGIEFIELEQPGKNYLSDYVAMQLERLI